MRKWMGENAAKVGENAYDDGTSFMPETTDKAI